MSKPDLNQSNAWPFESGAAEVRISVSRWNEDGSPAAFQAWVDPRNWSAAPRCVGIRGSAVAALRAAMGEFDKHTSGNAPAADDTDIEDLLG